MHLAIARRLVIVGQPVLGNGNWFLVSLEQELRSPIQNIRRNRPSIVRTRNVGRVRDGFWLPVRSGFDRRGKIKIYATEVQRLIDRLHLLRLYQLGCLRKELETILRILT